MRLRRWSFVAVAAGLAATAWLGVRALYATRPVAPPEPLAASGVASASPARAAAAAPPAVADSAAATAGEPPAALPASLEGTDADGAVTADAAGHLVIDLELRRLFDHFLAATGEEPLATMRARIIAVLRARLPAGAAAEATGILDRYLAYRDAARALRPTSTAAGLAQLHELRQRTLSAPVATAFFAGEEAAIAAALARRDALTDPALSADERARRLADLDARMPPAEREARAAATAPSDELAREMQMRAGGASDDDITAARTAALGSDAAARLAELDRAHAAWDARLTAFRAERARLLADPGLDAAERQRRVDELFAQSFTPPEQIRVEALDRIAAGRR